MQVGQKVRMVQTRQMNRVVQTRQMTKAEQAVQVARAEQSRAGNVGGLADGLEDPHDSADDHHSRVDGLKYPHSVTEDHHCSQIGPKITVEQKISAVQSGLKISTAEQRTPSAELAG